jgi:hypothetical protein
MVDRGGIEPPSLVKAMRYLAAYLIVLFLAPTFGGLAELVCTPIMGALIVPKVRDGNPRTPARIWSYALLSGLTAIVAGFTAIWFARAVFGWLRVEPTIARANDFLCKFMVSLLQTHRSKCILAAHALLNFFLDCHLQEATQLFVQFAVDPFLAEQ